MTEKQYGGASSHDLKETAQKVSKQSQKPQTNTEKLLSDNSEFSNISQKEIKTLKEVGHIAKQAVDYAKSIIKPQMPLLDIAEKIEAKIIELGGKPAFPVNLSINEIAAHYTPSYNDIEKAHGLLKVDIGVHKSGFIADTAFSIDLENSEENKKLIKAAENAVQAALKIIKLNISLNEIGKAVENAITSHGFQPIRNLSGHAIEPYDLHAGITIPNHSNSSPMKLPEGLYAIEPFSTTGVGEVRDGKPSGIYHLKKSGNVRDQKAREVLSFISEEYQTLPFCSRWIHKKFGTRALIALSQIEQAGLLHHYPQLIERNSGKVAQAEHTVIITEKEKIVTTE